jgi:ribosome recycling factor
MVNEVLDDFKAENKNTHDSLRRNLVRIRTGRAHAGILDPVRVECYGAVSPLNQVSAVTVPDPRQIVIKPWDKSIISDVERALMKASLGLTPINDGEVIRLNIPPLNTERRRELSRQVGRYGEDAKISIRNHRRDANELLKSLEKDKDISQDQMHDGQAQVQTLTDQFIKTIDATVAEKEAEILED